MRSFACAACSGLLGGAFPGAAIPVRGFERPDIHLAAVIENHGVRWQGVRQPDVAADDTVVAYMGVPAQDDRVGVDDNAVSNLGVAVDTLDRVAVRVQGEGARAQGDALVQLDIMAQHGGLADDDAGAVVNAEALADGRAGVDVYAGLLVRG